MTRGGGVLPLHGFLHTSLGQVESVHVARVRVYVWTVEMQKPFVRQMLSLLQQWEGTSADEHDV